MEGLPSRVKSPVDFRQNASWTRDKRATDVSPSGCGLDPGAWLKLGRGTYARNGTLVPARDRDSNTSQVSTEPAVEDYSMAWQPRKDSYWAGDAA